MSKTTLHDEALVTVNFRISEEELAEVDRIALKIGRTRSQMIRNLVTIGLEETEIFEKVGMVRAAITVRDILNWMKDKSQNRPEDIEQGSSDLTSKG